MIRPDWLFVSESEAVAAGATHAGYVFGVPVWIAHVGDDAPLMAAKFIPAESWISACLIAAQFLLDINVLERVPYYFGDALGTTAGA
jgi:hypothetical protein